MSTGNASLVNKLILLVLLLILACLVILIARQNVARKDEASSPVAQIVAEEASAPTSPERPKYLPSTNRATRRMSAPMIQPVSPEAAQPPPVQQPDIIPAVAAYQPAPVSLVNLPSRSSAAVPISSTGDANGAEIVGYVWLRGTPPPETPITLDATCGRLHTSPITTRHYLRTEDGRLANVFVYIKTARQGGQFPVPTNVAVVDNVNCLFEPYVSGVRTGQTIQFRNSDPLLHNVHAITGLNREFNLALPVRNYSFEKVFRVPEVFVRIKCDVHPWMFAYVGVVRHPVFAVSDREGIYRLPTRLLPGDYTVAAVHPKAGEVSQDVTVREGGTLQLDFTLSLPGEPSHAGRAAQKHP